MGDDDVFSILYNPEQDLALKVGIDLSAPTQSLGKEFANAAGRITDIAKLRELRKLKDIATGRSLGKGVGRVVGGASKLQSLKGEFQQSLESKASILQSYILCVSLPPAPSD